MKYVGSEDKPGFGKEFVNKFHWEIFSNENEKMKKKQVNQLKLLKRYEQKTLVFIYEKKIIIPLKKHKQKHKRL